MKGGAQVHPGLLSSWTGPSALSCYWSYAHDPREAQLVERCTGLTAASAAWPTDVSLSAGDGQEVHSLTSRALRDSHTSRALRRCELVAGLPRRTAMMHLAQQDVIGKDSFEGLSHFPEGTACVAHNSQAALCNTKCRQAAPNVL